MRRAYTYFLLLFFATPAAWSQECERNMLSTPNAFGYAKVNKGVVNLAGDFTIEFWMQASTFTKDAALFEQGRAGDSGTISIRLGSLNKIVSSFAFTTGRET